MEERPLKEWPKYQKTIDALKHRNDCCHDLIFMAGCGFGTGWNLNGEGQFSERRLREIARDREKYFTISELKEFFDVEENARLFFGLVPSESKVLYKPHHFEHWFCQTSERCENWKKIRKIIDDACQRIYGVPWGKQDQKVPNLIEPIGEYKPIPPDLLNKKEHLDIQEMKTEEVIPYLINRPVYWKDEFVGTVMKVENFHKYLFTKTVKDPTAEYDEPDHYDKDFYAECDSTLYLHEYYSEVKDRSILEFKDDIGLVIPMMSFADITVTNDRIILKENTNKKAYQAGAAANWMF